MYLLAILIPPLAVLLSGKLFQSIFNAIVWVSGLFTMGVTSVLAIIHACFVVGSTAGKKRHKEMMKELRTARN